MLKVNSEYCFKFRSIEIVSLRKLNKMPKLVLNFFFFFFGGDHRSYLFWDQRATNLEPLMFLFWNLGSRTASEIELLYPLIRSQTPCQHLASLSFEHLIGRIRYQEMKNKSKLRVMYEYQSGRTHGNIATLSRSA